MLQRIDDKEYSFDPNTGEIFYVYQYSEMKPMTQKEKDYYKYTKLNPKAVKSRQELEDFMSACVDKRKLITYNGTRTLHDMACGQAKREKERVMFTVPQYKTLNKLIKGLVYSNIFVGAKSELANILVCKQCDIKRTLNTIKHLIRVQEDGMRRGEIKVLVHPAYGFRYESGIINIARRQAINDWMRNVPIAEEGLPNKEFEMSDSFLKYLLGEFMCKVKSRQNNWSIKELGINNEVRY